MERAWLSDDLAKLPPPVIGAPPVPDRLDDVVYLPSRRVERGTDEVVIELRPTDDGRMAMLVFSSLEALVTGCGENQPWAAVSVESLPELQCKANVDLVVWDTVLHESQYSQESEGISSVDR